MYVAKPKTLGRFSRKSLPTTLNYFLSQKIELKGTGAWRDALCPFHEDTKPSLMVNIERGGYRCIAFGAHGGDVLAFHMHRYGLDFIEAAKQLKAWVAL